MLLQKLDHEASAFDQLGPVAGDGLVIQPGVARLARRPVLPECGNVEDEIGTRRVGLRGRNLDRELVCQRVQRFAGRIFHERDHDVVGRELDRTGVHFDEHVERHVLRRRRRQREEWNVVGGDFAAEAVDRVREHLARLHFLDGQRLKWDTCIEPVIDFRADVPRAEQAQWEDALGHALSRVRHPKRVRVGALLVGALSPNEGFRPLLAVGRVFLKADEKAPIRVVVMEAPPQGGEPLLTIEELLGDAMPGGRSASQWAARKLFSRIHVQDQRRTCWEPIKDGIEQPFDALGIPRLKPLKPRQRDRAALELLEPIGK